MCYLSSFELVCDLEQSSCCMCFLMHFATEIQVLFLRAKKTIVSYNALVVDVFLLDASLGRTHLRTIIKCVGSNDGGRGCKLW